MLWFPVVARLLLLFIEGAVGSEESACNHVEGLAGGLLGGECGCLDQSCTCLYVDDDHASGGCNNSCEYCAFGVCGVYSTSAARSDETDVTGSLLYTLGYSWGYTQGRSGDFKSTFTAATSSCTASFDDVECSCQYIQCADGTVSNLIDCSNIEAGAIVNYCLSDLGITSTDHLLIGLLVAGADTCSNSMATSPNPASQPVVAPTSVSSPTAVTPQPVAAPTSVISTPTSVTPQPITSTGIPPSQPSTGSPIDMSSTTAPVPQPSTALPIVSVPTSSAFMAFTGLKLSIILVVLLTMGIDNHW